MNRTHVCLIVLFALVTAVAPSSAEELHVVRGGPMDIDAIGEIDGVEVYAVMRGGLLVGADEGGLDALRRSEGSVETIVGIGERDPASDYYLIQVAPEDVDRLSPVIDLVYYDGREGVARLAKGTRFERNSRRIVRGLTHVAFIPRPTRRPRRGAKPAKPSRGNPDIQQIVDQVSQVEYTSLIQRLQDFVTRYSDTDSCRGAEQWALDTLAGLGLEAELFPYSGGGGTWNDVVGRLVGTVYPDSLYLIIAHLDDTSEDPYNLAPGAEDNGSGSACVLEAARVLSGYRFDCTIEFVLMTGEEQGLYGSEAYATYCFTEGRRIGGVLNFDMISYAGSWGWDTNIYSDQYFPEEVALADLLGQLTDLYSDAYSVRVNTVGPEYGSDHYYFSFYGFAAPFSIDAQMWSAPDFYPWYHTSDDVIGHLDLDFGTEVVKGAVATLATVAGLAGPPLLSFSYPDGLPDLVDPNGGTSFRVVVTSGTSDPQPGTGRLYYDEGSGFVDVPMDSVGPNIYDAVFPAVDCGADVSYFVGAETVEGTGVTDPPNAPSATFSAFAASNLVTLFEDDFETDQGWTVENDCQSGQWERGVPVGGDYRGNPPVDFDGSGRCYLTGNSPGDSDVDGGYTWLISPTFDLEGMDAMVRYALWYTNNFGNDPYNDLFKVWVSNDGGVNWTLAETIGPVSSAGWQERSFRVGDFVNPTAQVKVRFEASDLNQPSVVEAGIDAVQVVEIECGGPPDVSVTIVPDNPPIEVPPGGSFTFTGSLTNHSAEDVYTDAWIMVDVPGYGPYGPVFRLDDLHLPVGGAVTRPGLVQQVPLNAPPGLYTYTAYAGFYPSSPSDSSSFDFTVTAGAGPRPGRSAPGEWAAESLR